MDNGPFRYTKDIDKKIKDAIKESLNTKVLATNKIQKGEFNHVYKLETGEGTVVARVFRNQGWPEKDKPMWIEEKLSGLKVPHAKIIFHTRDNKFFPYGFMVTEFIEGLNGWDAITNNKITFEEYHRKLSETLAQIHKIKVGGYGSINGGKGHYQSFTESRLNKLKEIWQEAKKVENFPDSMYQKAEGIVRSTLEKFQDRFAPVLIHGDAGPDNSILTPDGQVILVDWDGAKASIWFEDYSWMMYWGSHVSSQGTREEREKKIFNSAQEIKDSEEFTQDELWELKRALHIIQAIDLLPYYFNDQKNMNAYNNTRERLESFLRD